MRMIELAPGLHPNIAHADYHQREAGIASKSALDLVRRSPAHLKAWLDGAEEEPTPALEFGSAFHCALLEPARYETTYAVEPKWGDCRKTENKAKRDDWRKDHDTFTLLDIEDAQAIVRMVKAVREHPLAGKMIRDGEPELTVRWNDAETGLPCKSRADYYVRRLGMVVDVKSSTDASYEAFRADVARYRYHVQDAMYRAGFAAAGAAVEHFVFVVVEKKPPHAIAIYALDEEGVAKGYSATRRDIDRLNDCVRGNDYPGYPTSIQTLNLPPWAA